MSETALSEQSFSRTPHHLAIIMDGNGRWAKKRYLPRIAGHRAGVEAVRQVVKDAAQVGVKVLTLFAFGRENWQRPEPEVTGLLDLFLTTLKSEVDNLHKNNVQLRIIGDRSRFDDKLQQQIIRAEKLTQQNDGLVLVIAVNYSGRWDITQACARLVERATEKEHKCDAVTSDAIRAELALAELPDPDLFIRTSGEQRISNFLVWHLAYTELYFTELLWPDFNTDALADALTFFETRERRFGRTSEQVKQAESNQHA